MSHGLALPVVPRTGEFFLKRLFKGKTIDLALRLSPSCLLLVLRQNLKIYSLGWPGAYHMYEAGLELLPQRSASASQLLELQA